MTRSDLVHLHVYDGALRFAFELKRRYGTRSVVTAHGLDMRFLSSGRYDRVEYVPYWTESVESVDAWVPCSPVDYRALLDWGIDEEKVVPIYNGVKVPQRLPLFRMTKEKGNRLEIAYIGRVIEKKGVLDLADAIIELKKRAPDLNLRLQIAGDLTSPMRKSLIERLARARGFVDYELLGEVNPDQVKKILRRADIFCYPSRCEEGLPLAILEAGAFGCPQIVSNAPGHLAVFQDGVHALFHRAGNITDLATAILRLAREQNLRCQLRENAYRLIKEKYNLKRMLNGYMDLYETLLTPQSC